VLCFSLQLIALEDVGGADVAYHGLWLVTNEMGFAVDEDDV